MVSSTPIPNTPDVTTTSQKWRAKTWAALEPRFKSGCLAKYAAMAASADTGAALNGNSRGKLGSVRRNGGRAGPKVSVHTDQPMN